MKNSQPLLSVVVPVYNEASGIQAFHGALLSILQEQTAVRYEVLYIDDGSVDTTNQQLVALAAKNTAVRVVRLTRNFGKEIATTAGIHAAAGDAILMLDADGQHPVKLIPQFVAAWQAGAKVVMGKRTGREANLLKRAGSKLFHGAFRRLTGIKMSPGSSDFCLIDQTVQAEFNRLTERNRMTRGLIDWLGYQREHVLYVENARLGGKSPYSFRKLLRLAIDSAVSLSISPLYVTAYIGAVVLPLATLLGIGMATNFVLGDPLGLHATGSAYLMVLVLFLVGILLVSQGIIGLYLSHIHSETQNRPLYIIDKAHSKGVNDERTN